MSLEAVFLDVGNTLVYEVPSRFEIYRNAAVKRGVELSTREMIAHMVEVNDELPTRLDGAFRYSDPWFQAYVARIFLDRLGIDAGELPTITTELFDRFEDPTTFRLYDGARELIARCREAGLIVGVISNWSARLPRVLDGLDLTSEFDFVLCSAIVEMEKPEPAIFEHALELAGAAPDACLHAGDHPDKDVRAALGLGIRSVLVDHADRHADLELPRVTSLNELADSILSFHP